MSPNPRLTQRTQKGKAITMTESGRHGAVAAPQSRANPHVPRLSDWSTSAEFGTSRPTRGVNLDTGEIE